MFDENVYLYHQAGASGAEENNEDEGKQKKKRGRGSSKSGRRYTGEIEEDGTAPPDLRTRRRT